MNAYGYFKYPLIMFIILSCGNLAKVTHSKRSGAGVKVNSKTIPDRDSDPFEQFAQFLIQVSKNDEFDQYTSDEVRRTVKKLAAGQEALKTMDGAAHQLRSSFSDSTSSLSARFNKFISGEKKKLKEAGKLYEYVTTVERSLQAAEILQAVSQKTEKERLRWMKAAGLREIKRVTIFKNKVSCTLSVMAPLGVEQELDPPPHSGEDTELNEKPTDNDSSSKKKTKRGNAAEDKSTRLKSEQVPRFSAGELVVGIVDDLVSTLDSTGEATKRLLQTMTQRADCLSLNSVGLVKEELIVQPTLLAIAVDALDELADCILALAVPLPDLDILEIGSSSDSDVALKGILGVEGEVALGQDGPGTSRATPFSMPPSPQEEVLGPVLTAAGHVVPTRISIAGHSAGGAVGAYVAMVLEGFLNCTDTPLMVRTKRFVGTYSGRVGCICLGPPPCVSRAVVPRFVSSVICGDDAVPRASPESLANVESRVLKALKAGAGDKMGLRWKVGSAWISDLQSVAGKGIGQYAGGSHDLSALSVPGRAFYIKNRRHKQGASMQRVLRGQWREDILWTLHEVLLSKRMLEHHSLEEHVKTLSRC